MAAQNSKVLVVDDMAIARKKIAKSLKAVGYENATLAGDGTDDWDIIQEQLNNGEYFQLIVSDWNMAQMNGIELLKKIRAQSEIAKTPFIIITAESEQSTCLEAIKTGANEYLFKPNKEDELKEKVYKLIGEPEEGEEEEELIAFGDEDEGNKWKSFSKQMIESSKAIFQCINIKSQPQEWDLMFSCILCRKNFSFNSSISKSTRY